MGKKQQKYHLIILLNRKTFIVAPYPEAAALVYYLINLGWKPQSPAWVGNNRVRMKSRSDGDAQVHKGVHDNQVDDLLELHPRGAAVPYEHFMGTFVPPWWAFLVGLFQL